MLAIANTSYFRGLYSRIYRTAIAVKYSFYFVKSLILIVLIFCFLGKKINFKRKNEKAGRERVEKGRNKELNKKWTRVWVMRFCSTEFRT